MPLLGLLKCLQYMHLGPSPIILKKLLSHPRIIHPFQPFFKHLCEKSMSFRRRRGIFNRCPAFRQNFLSKQNLSLAGKEFNAILRDDPVLRELERRKYDRPEKRSVKPSGRIMWPKWTANTSGSKMPNERHKTGCSSRDTHISASFSRRRSRGPSRRNHNRIFPPSGFQDGQFSPLPRQRSFQASTMNTTERPDTASAKRPASRRITAEAPGSGRNHP